MEGVTVSKMRQRIKRDYLKAVNKYIDRVLDEFAVDDTRHMKRVQIADLVLLQVNVPITLQYPQFVLMSNSDGEDVRTFYDNDTGDAEYTVYLRRRFSKLDDSNEDD